MKTIIVLYHWADYPEVFQTKADGCKTSIATELDPNSNSLLTIFNNT